MDLETLRFANFKLLDGAITDWSTTVGNLKKLHDAADKGLRGQANDSNWSGTNATISKKFIGKTAGEFADAHTQASSIHNILRDTRDELKDYQRVLNEALDRGLKKNLTVVSTQGGGFTVSMNIHPERAARGTTVPEHSQKDVTDLRDEIQAILDGATETDTTADTVLQAIVDQSKVGFSDAQYQDRDTAADAVKEADELAKLAKKKPEDLTVKEFDRLNAGLKKYANDDLFAERFATKLGARGTLDFWADINEPRLTPELNQERNKQFADLQKNLGLTLATATQSDTAAMTDWKRQIVDLGDKGVGRGGSGPMGFQVMSNLMRWGDYDDAFLKSYGSALIATEKKLGDNGDHVPGAWEGPTFMEPDMNRTGTDSGYDPMTGFMKALSNSPDAATEFFSDTFVTKDEDHEFMEDKDDDGNRERRALSNFDYLFEERDWPHDADEKGEKSIAGRNNLAMALEAATTGHPAGELPTADLPPHNAEQAKLMESLVASISDDNERLTKYGYMSDSIGQIASEYLPDINRSNADVDPKDKDAVERINQLFPVAGSAAEMQHRDVTRFLFTIGQNPEGYAAVEVGQVSYMSNLMDYHLNPHLPADRRYSSDMELTVREVAHASGEVSGTLAVGRQEAVAGPADEDDKNYDHATSQLKSGISGGLGTAVGVGTAFIASPVVGAAVGGATTTVSGLVLEQLFKDAEGHAKDDAGYVMGENWENSKEENASYTRRAAEAAAKTHHIPNPSDVAEWARTSNRDGFLAGGQYVDRMAPELKTDI
ncbi:hypothetical protein [Streptomyces sp. NPDC002187]|uniref:hypothetical protein n=1 Tax=Streptomyces sp. NPDC002187 TaxID=3364637 RepID=UPI00367476A3